MANLKSKDPLDALPDIINDILIQTGRAFKKAREDGPRDLDHVQNSLRSHMEHSMNEFHRNLDDIECEIVHAKAILLRDLEKARASRVPPPELAAPKPSAAKAGNPHTPPTQVAHAGLSQAKAGLKQQHAPVGRPQPPVKTPTAPFPDMVGIDIQSPGQPSPKIKREAISPAAHVSTPPKPSPRAVSRPLKSEARPSPPTHMPVQVPTPTPVQAPTPNQVPTPVPIPIMDDKMGSDPYDFPASGAGVFTEMAFRIDPSSDGADPDLSELDSFLADPTGASSTLSGTAPTAPMAMMGTVGSIGRPSEKKGSQTQEAGPDIYDIDNIDSMEIDFTTGLPADEAGDISEPFYLTGDLSDLEHAFQ